MKAFANVDTKGIEHGQRVSAAEFRQLAKLDSSATLAQNHKMNVKQGTKSDQKPRRSSNKQRKANQGVELPWFTIYLKEIPFRYQ